jgi:hypothetical protein
LGGARNRESKNFWSKLIKRKTLRHKQKKKMSGGANGEPHRNVLFFSKQCPHSRKFCEMLMKKPDLEASFVKICVDTAGKLPNFVQRVPTIVVTDDTGRRQEPLTDGHAFQWLKQQVEQMAGEFVAYDATTMSSSLSDAFSFVGDENADDHQHQKHTYAWVDQMNDFEITQGGRGAGANSRESERIAQQDQAYQRFLDQRNRDIPLRGGGDKPPEIDFTQPLAVTQQRLKAQEMSAKAKAVEDTRRRDAQARIARQRNAVDFQSAEFRAGQRAPPAAVRRAPPPRNAREMGRHQPLQQQQQRVGGGRMMPGGEPVPGRRAAPMGRQPPPGWKGRR